MKIVFILLLILSFRSLLLETNRKLLNDKVEEETPINISLEMGEIKTIVDSVLPSNTWTSEMKENNKLLISEKIGDKDLAILEIKFDVYQPQTPPGAKPITSLILQNKPDDIEDKRFDRFKTSHIIYRREFKNSIKGQLAVYIQNCLNSYNNLLQKYQTKLIPSTLSSKIQDYLIFQAFPNFEVKELLKSENICILLFQKTGQLQYSMITTITKVNQNFILVEIKENANVHLFFVSDTIHQEFLNHFGIFISQRLNTQTDQNVDVKILSTFIEKSANQLCSSQQVRVEVLNGSPNYSVISLKPTIATSTCVFADSVFFLSKYMIDGSQMFHLFFEGQQMQSEYFFVASQNNINGLITAKMNDILRTSGFITQELGKSNKEVELKEDDFSNFLVSVFPSGNKVDLEITPSEKKDVEVDGRLFLKKWSIPEKDLIVYVFKNSSDYIIEINAKKSKKGTFSLIVPVINGYDLKNLIKSQIDEFLMT